MPLLLYSILKSLACVINLQYVPWKQKISILLTIKKSFDEHNHHYDAASITKERGTWVFSVLTSCLSPPYLTAFFFVYGFEYEFLPWNWLLARQTGYASRGRIDTTRICVKSPPSRIFRGTVGCGTFLKSLQVGNVWYIVSNNDNCDWLLLGVEWEMLVILDSRVLIISV